MYFVTLVFLSPREHIFLASIGRRVLQVVSPASQGYKKDIGTWELLVFTAKTKISWEFYCKLCIPNNSNNLVGSSYAKAAVVPLLATYSNLFSTYSR